MFSALFGPEGHPLSHPKIVQGRRGDSLEGGAGRPCGSMGWEAGDTPGERVPAFPGPGPVCATHSWHMGAVGVDGTVGLATRPGGFGNTGEGEESWGGGGIFATCPGRKGMTDGSARARLWPWMHRRSCHHSGLGDTLLSTFSEAGDPWGYRVL